VNLKVNSYFPDDIYQGHMREEKRKEGRERAAFPHPVPFQAEEEGNANAIVNKKEEEDGFSTLVMPFANFVLTKAGVEIEQQRSLDGSVNIEHIGFMLADGVDGDFQLDISSIRAVNYINNEMVDDLMKDEEEHDPESLESRRQRGF